VSIHQLFPSIISVWEGTYAEYSCSMCIISLEEYFALWLVAPDEAGVSVLVAIGAIVLSVVYN
jgi:hypothetical protein